MFERLSLEDEGGAHTTGVSSLLVCALTRNLRFLKKRIRPAESENISRNRQQQNPNPNQQPASKRGQFTNMFTPKSA